MAIIGVTALLDRLSSIQLQCFEKVQPNSVTRFGGLSATEVTSNSAGCLLARGRVPIARFYRDFSKLQDEIQKSDGDFEGECATKVTFKTQPNRQAPFTQLSSGKMRCAAKKVTSFVPKRGFSPGNFVTYVISRVTVSVLV
jgi:hypothetical protein